MWILHHLAGYWSPSRPGVFQALLERSPLGVLPVVFPHIVLYSDVVMPQEHHSKLDLLQGTLDMMVLQTLRSMGPLHGYGIARRIEQVSGDEVLLNQGTIYASLVRLQQRGWISSKWGTSETNRRARFYALTSSGRKQLAERTSYWHRLSDVVGRVLGATPEAQ